MAWSRSIADSHSIWFDAMFQRHWKFNLKVGDSRPDLYAGARDRVISLDMKVTKKGFSYAKKVEPCSTFFASPHVHHVRELSCFFS